MTSHRPPLEGLISQYFDRIPFHRHLGIHLQRFDPERCEFRIEMQPELVGNYHLNILHGGVTATLLDLAGGCTAFNGILTRHPDAPVEFFERRLAKLGTIDLRVDYLRPGKGQHFIASGEVIRTGARLAVCRMELHNEKGSHIAFGTGTYMVG